MELTEGAPGTHHRDEQPREPAMNLQSRPGDRGGHCTPMLLPGCSPQDQVRGSRRRRCGPLAASGSGGPGQSGHWARGSSPESPTGRPRALRLLTGPAPLFWLPEVRPPHGLRAAVRYLAGPGERRHYTAPGTEAGDIRRADAGVTGNGELSSPLRAPRDPPRSRVIFRDLA